MRLHVLAGSPELLRPKVLTSQELTGLFGPGVQTVAATWLSPEHDDYHTFLQDDLGDRRTSVMAWALKDEFGTRFEPLLVLPDLFDEIERQEKQSSRKEIANRRSQITVLSEICAQGNLQQLRLYGLALPEETDPDGCWAMPAGLLKSAVRERIEKLRSVRIAHIESDAIETEVVEATPSLPIFRTLYDNSVCNELATRLAPVLREHGWNSDNDVLPETIGSILADWEKKGISPNLALRAHELDTMTRLIYTKLL